jgi:DNA-directed RNA polymerase subunit RPC12/RpoP
MQAICCGECSWPVPVEGWNRDEGTRCPGCSQRIDVMVFPAIEGKPAGALPEALIADTEASCFYHPSSRAAVPCDECGRFLCSLCDIQIDARHLCPVCFQSGVRSNKLEVAETQRTMYDTIALVLATLPGLLFWPAIVTAPAALWVIVRRWRAPGSVVPRTRIRFYLAALFALGEIGLLAFVIMLFIKSFQSGRR